MKKTLILLAALSFLCINCKPKSAEKKENTPIDSLSVAKDTAVSVKKNEAVFFKASGTEPFWGLEVSEDSVRFTSPETEKNFTLAYKMNKAVDANVVSYEAKSDSIHLKFTIQEGKCSDNMSDKLYAYSVKASLKRGKDKDFTTLQGCGNYIVDERLHGTWVLEELEGKTMEAKDFEKKLPFIDINTIKREFTGFAGCNGMGGKLFYKKETFRFSDIFTTEMMCPNYDKEKIFVKALQSTTHYEIKNDKLYLFNPDGTKAVFRKKA